MTASLPTAVPIAADPQKRSLPTRSWRWWVVAAGLVLLPLILSAVLLASRQAAYTDLFPFWNDEVYYHHQAATFARVGFEGGYYTYNEVPAAAPFSHFYTWGIVIPAFYGSISSVFGWPPWAIPVANLVLMCLAIALWVFLVRPRPIQMGAACLLLMFGPFIMYNPTSMIEVMHMAWGIAIAGILYAFSKTRETPQALWWGVLVMAVLTVATGFRVTWGLLLPIVGAMWLARWGWRGFLLGGFTGVILAAGMYFFFNWTSAPYPGPLITPAIFKEGLGAGLAVMANHIGENIQALTGDDLPQLLVRAQVVGLWVVVCATILRQWRLPRRATRQTYDVWEFPFYSALTIGLFALILVFYSVGNWRDYRQFASFVMCFGFLVVARQRWGLFILLTLSSLIMLSSAVQTFSSWASDYRNQSEIRDIMQDWDIEIDEVLRYDPNAKSAWCNTLTFNPSFFAPPYLPSLVEPGIGLTMLFEKSDAPLKAQYLMLADEFLVLHESVLNLEPIFEVPAGMLYRNLDADC